MTINISLSINDGMIIAADSATTISANGARLRVYNNADKIFNLIKGLPLASTTAGAGNIGNKTIATLTKDLRARMTKDSDELYVDPENYTVHDVAIKAANFFASEFDRCFPNSEPGYEMLYRVFGYSSNKDESEGWGFVLTDKNPPAVTSINNGPSIAWCGMTDAINRLVNGVTNRFVDLFPEVDQRELQGIYSVIMERSASPLWSPLMPLQDGIDVVKFLANTSANYAKMTDLAAGVGGPIEIASITRHEGFKWIERKHFFRQDLN